MTVVLYRRLNHVQTITLMLRALNAQPKRMEMYGIPIPVFVMIVVAKIMVDSKIMVANKEGAVEPLPS